MYSEAVMREFQSPHRQGALAGATGIGQAGVPGQGPFLTIYLRAESGVVSRAAYETYGCPAAVACGSWVARWAEGRRLEELGVLTADDLMLVLGGLPLGKEHAAALAVQALQKAAQAAENRA